MPAHNILVVIVDGLRASALGAYGNTSFPTPALDRFAADSFLLDWCYASSIDLADVYRALWRPYATPLLEQMKALGYAMSLVTDDPILTSFPAATDFHNCLQLSTNPLDPVVTTTADETVQTSLARLFATAAEAVASTTGGAPKLVWLHSRGMYGPWDAPLDLQRSLLDEDDPPPVKDLTPPDFVLAASDDPDAAFRYGCAYAAQAMVLDECWETLLGAVNTAGGADRWIVALVGARGYPLGEHNRIGGVDPRLYVEQLHVPWLIRFPDSTGRLARSNQLTTHADLAPSLVDSVEGASVRALATSARTPWRDALIATSSAGCRAIRTADWCLRRDPHQQLDNATRADGDTSPASVELFVRPDDRWEANDVAKLCLDVVESLIKRLGESP